MYDTSKTNVPFVTPKPQRGWAILLFLLGIPLNALIQAQLDLPTVWGWADHNIGFALLGYLIVVTLVIALTVAQIVVATIVRCIVSAVLGVLPEAGPGIVRPGAHLTRMQALFLIACPILVTIAILITLLGWTNHPLIAFALGLTLAFAPYAQDAELLHLAQIVRLPPGTILRVPATLVRSTGRIVRRWGRFS